MGASRSLGLTPVNMVPEEFCYKLPTKKYMPIMLFGRPALRHKTLPFWAQSTKGGWIKVDETESGKIIRFGDCFDLLPKSALQVLDAMPVIGHNLKGILDAPINSDGETATRPGKLKKTLMQPEVYVCTIAKRDGVALTPLRVTCRN